MIKRFVLSSFLLAVLSGCQSLSVGVEQKAVPDFIQVEQFVSQGEAAYRKGELEKARSFFERAIALDIEDEQSNYRLGNIYFRNGDLKKSAHHFSKVVSKNPQNAKAHYNLGTIHLMFAENHMKFFTASAPRDFDISNVSKLLGDLDEFSSGGSKAKQSAAPVSAELDKLVNLIESP